MALCGKRHSFELPGEGGQAALSPASNAGHGRAKRARGAHYAAQVALVEQQEQLRLQRAARREQILAHLRARFPAMDHKVRRGQSSFSPNAHTRPRHAKILAARHAPKEGSTARRAPQRKIAWTPTPARGRGAPRRLRAASRRWHGDQQWCWGKSDRSPLGAAGVLHATGPFTRGGEEMFRIPVC